MRNVRRLAATAMVLCLACMQSTSVVLASEMDVNEMSDIQTEAKGNENGLVITDGDQSLTVVQDPVEQKTDDAPEEVKPNVMQPKDTTNDPVKPDVKWMVDGVEIADMTGWTVEITTEKDGKSETKSWEDFEGFTDDMVGGKYSLKVVSDNGVCFKETADGDTLEGVELDQDSLDIMRLIVNNPDLTDDGKWEINLKTPDGKDDVGNEDTNTGKDDTITKPEDETKPGADNSGDAETKKETVKVIIGAKLDGNNLQVGDYSVQLWGIQDDKRMEILYNGYAEIQDYIPGKFAVRILTRGKQFDFEKELTDEDVQTMRFDTDGKTRVFDWTLECVTPEEKPVIQEQKEEKVLLTINVTRNGQTVSMDGTNNILTLKNGETEFQYTPGMDVSKALPLNLKATVKVDGVEYTKDKLGNDLTYKVDTNMIPELQKNENGDRMTVWNIDLGEASTNSPAPKTGDTTDAVVWVMTMLGAAMVLIQISKYKFSIME